MSSGHSATRTENCTLGQINGAIHNKVNLVPRASAIAFQQHYTNSYSQM